MENNSDKTVQRSSIDEIVALYARDIDKTALIENLKLTPQQRSERFLEAMDLVFELRKNAKHA